MPGLFKLQYIAEKENPRVSGTQNKKKEEPHRFFLFFLLYSERRLLFYLIYDCFECFGMVHCQIGKDFAVNFNFVFVQSAHQAGV